MGCPKILHRHSKPGPYDMVPHGTICKVATETPGRYEFYRQESPSEDAPLWELIESFVEAKD